MPRIAPTTHMMDHAKTLFRFDGSPLRRHLVGRVLLALVAVSVYVALVYAPVAAQTTVTPAHPCLASRNLTDLPNIAQRNITNQPVLSSSGGRVAFWSTNNLVADGNNDGNIEIFVQDTNSGSIVQLTDSVGSILGGFNLEPSINTAGDRIAFFSDRDLVGTNVDGNFEIFLARRVSGVWTIKQVTDTTGSANLFPSINGDGTRIAFVSDDPALDTVDKNRLNADRNFEIMLATVSTSGNLQQIRQLTDTSSGITNDQPSISADGSRIAYSAGSGQSVQVYVWDVTTDATTQLTTSGNSEQTSINGDGTRVTYITTNSSGGQSRVVLHHLSEDGTESTSQVIVPSASNTKYRSPSISSNGERIAYVVEQGTGDNRTVYVRLYDVNTGIAADVSDSGGLTAEQPTISGDGSRVTFVGADRVAGSTASSGSDIYIDECPQADLQLTLTNPPPATSLAGVDLNYTLKVVNAGPSVAANVTIRSDLASLPALPTNVSRVLPNNCTVSVNELVCDLGTLAVNGQASVTLGFDVPGNAQLADIVSRYTVEGDVVDPRPNDNDTGELKTRITEEAALTLGVTTDTNLILAGSNEILTYTLTIKNAGPSQARGAVLTDTLPSQVTLVNAVLVSGGGTGAQCPQTANNTSVVCKLGDLGVGSTTVVRIGIKAKAAAPSTLNNVAVVRSVTDELDKTDNTVTTATTVDRAADLVITKSASAASVVAGTEITYTFFITNSGPADTTGVSATDLLPTDVRFVRNATTSGGSCAAGDVTNTSVSCTVTGTMAPNTSRRLDFVARVLSTAPAGTISNTASVVSQRRDPVTGNNTSNAVQTTVTLLADLGVIKELSSPLVADNINVFDVITFTIQVRNDGPSQAYSVVVTDDLPDGLTFERYTATAGFYSDVTHLWTLNQPLPVDQTETLQLAAKVESVLGGETVTNTATVSGGQPEPQPNNNQNSYSVDIKPNLADLAVGKTSLPLTATAGKPVTYTITVTNSGPTRARGVVVTDHLPTGVNFVSATPDPSQTGDLCSRSGSTVTCTRNPSNLGTLDAGATLTYRIVITHTTAEIITNTVSVSSSTPDITATNDGYTLPVTINPDVPATLLLIESPPSSVTAGDAFTPSPVVQIRDKYGNLVKVGTGATDTIRFVAYTSATCTTATGTSFINRDQDAVAGVATFANLSYTKAQTIYLRAEDQELGRTGVKSACAGPVNVLPGAVNKFALTVDHYPAQPIVAGATRTLTVTAQDAFSNVATSYTGSQTLVFTGTGPSPDPITYPTVAGIGFGGSTPLTFANGVAADALALYLADTFTLTASAGPVSGTTSLTVIADTATSLHIDNAPSTVQAGVKSDPITVARHDGYGNFNTTDAPVTVVLTSTSAGAYGFFTETGTITVPVAVGVVIGTGSSSVNVRYRDTLAGLHTLYVSDKAAVLTSETTAITVTPASATRLVYASAPYTIAAGTDTGAITVAREDPFGNRNTTDGDLTVLLDSSSAGAFAFRQVPVVGGTITQTVIISGASQVDYYYTDTLSGTHSITAAVAGGGLTSAVQPLTVQPANASKLVMLTAAQTVTAGVVSDVYTVQRQDLYGNPNDSQGNLQLTLDSTSSSDGFLNEALAPTLAVTIPQTKNSASFYYTDTAQGVYTITVSGSGVTPVAQAVTVTAAAATKLVFVAAPPTTAAAGFAAGPFTLERRDPFGNPNHTDALLTVALTTTSPGTAIGGPPEFSANSLVITSVDIVTSTVSFDYQDSKAGTHTITANGGGTLTATTAITVEPGAVSKLVFITPNRTITAGTTSLTMTVQTQDLFSNIVTPTIGSPITAALSSGSAGVVHFYNDAAAEITEISFAGSSTANFHYDDTKAGSPSVYAAPGSGLGISDGVQLVTVNADTAKKIVFVTSPQTVAAGAPSDVITVQRQDQFGNPNTADSLVTVDLTKSASSGAFVTPTVAVTVTSVAINPGTAAANFLYYDSVRGTKSITASVSSYLTPTVSQPVTVTGGTAVKLALSGLSTTTAGVPISLTVTALDSFGNVADGYIGSQTLIFGGAGVAPSGDDPDVDGHLLGTGTPLNFTEGIATTSAGANGVLALYLAETATITAADGAVSTEPDGNLTVTVSAAPTVTVEAQTVAGDLVGDQSIPAGTSIDIYARGLDLYRNPTGPIDANWQIAVTGNVTTTDLAPTVGVSVTTFTGNNVGTAVITPTFTGLVPVSTGLITVLAGQPTQVRVETSPDGLGSIVPWQEISAGTTITMYAVTRDAMGNFVGNPAADTWSVTGNGGVATSDLVTTTGGTFTVFRGRVAGSGTVAANINGLTVVPSGIITVTPGSAAYLRLTAPGSTFTAGITQTLSITALDSFANVAVGYNGLKSLTFAGAQPSEKLMYTPTVVDNGGTAIEFTQPMSLTFNSGVLDNGGTTGGLTLYRAGTDIAINATEGSITGSMSVTVNRAARERLDISGSSVITAGVPVNLTIRAVDLYGNVDTTYTSPPAEKLAFYGAATAPDGSNYPTVTANNGATRTFGQDTNIDFVSGVSSVSGSNNGVMTLVAVESTTINVLDSNNLSLDSEPYGGLAVTVLPGLTQGISLNLTSPQIVSQTFTGASSLLILDQYQNPVTNYNAATRPITITGNLAFANGTINLAGSGNDNVLDETNDVIDGRAVLTTTGLGMVYIGPSGTTGTFIAAAAPPQQGQATITSGTSGNVSINPGMPMSVTLQGKLGTGAYTSTLPVTAGQPISLQVSLRDIAGNLTPLGSSSFGLTFAGAPLTGGTPPDPTVTDNGNTTVAFGQTTTLDFSSGQSAVTGGGANGLLRLYQVGVYTITATGSSVLTPPDGGLVVTVTPGPLAQLDLQLTTPQVNGQQFAGPNTLTMRDAFANELTDWENSGGNVVFTAPTSVTATITFAGSEGDNQLETKDFSSGVANLGTSPPFEGITYTGLSGLATIQAQSGAVTGTATVTITAGPLAQLDLQLTTLQTNTQEFVGTNTLTVRDVSGNVLTNWGNGSANVVFTVLPSSGATLTFSGSGGDNQLEPADFAAGIADLSTGSKGMIYTGPTGTAATIQAQSGAVTGTDSININAPLP